MIYYRAYVIPAADTPTPTKSKKPRVLVRDLPQGGVGCAICYKKFATELRMSKHLARSHPTGATVSTVCDTCGRSFRNKEQWRNHNRQVSCFVTMYSTKWVNSGCIVKVIIFTKTFSGIRDKIFLILLQVNVFAKMIRLRIL